MNSRLEAFCDGVFAIAITLLVIDIKIPANLEIDNAAALWQALWHILPSILAFLLSFVVILITWVNHHNALKLLHKSHPTLLYGNGFLLLTVAFLPFPTSLLGEYVLTPAAAPAVILYDSVLALQALGWTMITTAATKHALVKNEKAKEIIRSSKQYSYFAFILYTLCTILAYWFPLAMAIVVTATWIFWLVWGMTIRQEEV